MDKTLIDKPPPSVRLSPPFSQSPTFGPAIRWLQRGGRLCVVTTDDGHRPFQKVWNDIPAELRADRRVVFATSDGAAIFYGDEEGNLREDTAYTAHAESGAGAGTPGCSLRLPTGDSEMEELLGACREVYLRYVDDLAGDAALLASLDGRVRTGFERIVAALQEEGLLGGADVAQRRRLRLEELLSRERLALPGAVLPVGTMIWRNQAGPMDQWVRAGGREDPYFGFYGAEGLPQPAYTNLFMMGMPKHLSGRYIESGAFAEALASLGLRASAAPNSICVMSAAARKDLPVQWLARRPEYDLDFSRTVVFGDNPLGNDRPLASLPAPFVSVAPELRMSAPVGCELGGFYHVGGCEAGTALVLEMFLQALEAGDGYEEALRQLPDMCADVAARLSGQGGEAPAAAL